MDGKTLKTAGAEVSEIKMSASERVFQKLWRPEVMFILMLIAIYGIIGELTTPGAILPGVVGRDCVDPRALSGGDSAGQRDRTRLDRARTHALYL